MNNLEYSIVNEIRFLPNDKTTFPTYEDIKCFLTETMKNRDGVYNYTGLSMNCKENTLVFFQYNGSLIASAILMQNVRGRCYDEAGDEYKGHYVFDMNTMQVFNTPISADEVRSIDSTFKNFSQCKRIVDISLLDEMVALIEKNR